MSRVPGLGISHRPRRGMSVWILVTAIAIFLVIMLPAERKKPQAVQQPSKVAEEAMAQVEEAAVAAAAESTGPATGEQQTEGAAADDNQDGATEQPIEQQPGDAAATATAEAEDAAAARTEPAQPKGATAAGLPVEPATDADSAGGSTTSSSPGTGTGIFFEVPAPKEGDPPTKTEMLNELVPDDCFMEEHADYDGPSLTWGLTFKLPSAAQCCQACKERKKPQADGMRCNIWVWCGSPTGECWSPDIWNHTTGECWLKFQIEWDNNVDRSATNLIVNRRGVYEPEYRQEHKTSPDAVAWTAGVIPADRA